MIGKLTGRIDSLHEDYLVLDVNGVGYLVFASTRTLSLMPQAGGNVSLLIDTHVREDHIHLYGFANAAEQIWFRTLTTVQGVGVKVALAILGTLSPDQLLTALAAQDKKAFTAVSGVGPKLAERIVTELKGQAVKLSGAGFTMPAHSDAPAAKGKAAAAKPSSAIEDALSALVHLGYNRSDAFTAVMRVQQNAPDAKLDQLIKDSLRELAA